MTGLETRFARRLRRPLDRASRRGGEQLRGEREVNLASPQSEMVWL